MDRSHIVTIGSQETRVSILETDIFVLNHEVLVIPTMTGNMWGGLSGQLNSYAGPYYAQTLQTRMLQGGLKHGHTFLVKAHPIHQGEAGYGDILFVLDDFETGIGDIIKAVLRAADAAGYKRVSIPAIRTGIQLGVYGDDEATLEATLERIVQGLLDFLRETPHRSLAQIDFVTYYRTPEVYNRFVEALTDAVSQ